jgi:hypothetical protein
VAEHALHWQDAHGYRTVITVVGLFAGADSHKGNERRQSKQYKTVLKN